MMDNSGGLSSSFERNSWLAQERRWSLPIIWIAVLIDSMFLEEKKLPS